ncbi:MAG: GerMN domain-containing protein [Actinobacteria bacterium]|nr:GerMN domain-containing protein [Actinomycetota bacterium]MCA1720216.1 GerMN domain-containing protein [Actinomycetota bacterium]
MRILVPLLLVPLAAGCAGSVSAPAAVRTPAPALSVAPSPSPSPSSAPSPSAQPPRATALRTVYYLHDDGRGPRLYREQHRRSATTGVIRDAVTAMLTEKPVDGDYTSLWPRTTTVRGARLSGTTAYVDLSADARRGDGGAEAEAMSLQQLVHTVVAAAPAVKAVQVLVEGKVVPDLWGHVDTSKPIPPGEPSTVLGPVWVLTSGSIARGGTFGGEATVFEATVSWEIRQGGQVVQKGFTNASTGAPGRGTWSAKADVPPGSYVLRAFESSAEDGRPLWVDDKPLQVR